MSLSLSNSVLHLSDQERSSDISARVSQVPSRAGGAEIPGDLGDQESADRRPGVPGAAGCKESACQPDLTEDFPLCVLYQMI